MPYINDVYYIKYAGALYPKTPIILMHGVGGSHLSWPTKLRRLSGHDVYTIDLPGHGKSKGVAAQTIYQYTDTLIDFLSGLGIYKAVFVGHSLGSAIALQMAVDHPNHVAGLGILCGAASYQIGTGYLQEFRSTVTLPTALQKLERSLVNTETAVSVTERKSVIPAGNHPSLWYTDFAACARFDVRQKLQQINLPTFIAAGRLDEVVPFSHSAYLASQIPHAVFQEYRCSGHLLPLEEPDRLHSDIMKFLNTHYL